MARNVKILSSIAALALVHTGSLAARHDLSEFRLPDGQRTLLTAEGKAQRSRLNPSPVPTTLPAYHPISCEYEERASTKNGTTVSQTTLIIEPVVPDKLFFHKTGGTGEGTMLMDNTGKELDRNMSDFDHTINITPEQAAAIAEKRKTSLSAHLTGAHLLAEFIEIPHFIATSAQPGDRVADVTDEKGDAWGTYYYRGLVQMGGNQGELYDIVHTAFGAPAVRGFIVMDKQRGLPLMTNFSFDNYRSRELYMKSCKAP